MTSGQIHTAIVSRLDSAGADLPSRKFYDSDDLADRKPPGDWLRLTVTPGAARQIGSGPGGVLERRPLATVSLGVEFGKGIAPLEDLESVLDELFRAGAVLSLAPVLRVRSEGAFLSARSRNGPWLESETAVPMIVRFFPA